MKPFQLLKNPVLDRQLKQTAMGGMIHDLDAAKAAIDAEIDHTNKSQAAVRIVVGIIQALEVSIAPAKAEAELTGKKHHFTDTEKAQLQVLGHLLRGPYQSAVFPIIHAAFPSLAPKGVVQ